MTVAYDGAPFSGFADNAGVLTVAGTISEALAGILGHPVELACAGRTDRGVHARGQVVSFDALGARADPARLQRSLNRLCGPTIAVREAQFAADDFHARLSCTGRVYRYRILAAPVPDPLAAATSWQISHPLDLEAMRGAAEQVVGTHDFSSFCRRNRSRPDAVLVRTVRRTAWWREGDFCVFEIEGRSFCHQMVRSLVGTFVAVGRGRRSVTDLEPILAARDRNAAASPAPAHGLMLWAALYD